MKKPVFLYLIMVPLLFLSACQEQPKSLKEAPGSIKSTINVAALDNKIIEVHGTLRLVGNRPFFVYVVSDSKHDYFLDIPPKRLNKYTHLQNKPVKVVGKLVIMRMTTPNKRYTTTRYNIQLVSLTAL